MNPTSDRLRKSVTADLICYNRIMKGLTAVSILFTLVLSLLSFDAPLDAIIHATQAIADEPMTKIPGVDFTKPGPSPSPRPSNLTSQTPHGAKRKRLTSPVGVSGGGNNSGYLGGAGQVRFGF